MKYAISKETLKRTTCRNSFHCLSGEMEGVCEIFNAAGPKTLVTDCPKRDWACKHCRPFDVAEGFCMCPTRRELFERYGI